MNTWYIVSEFGQFWSNQNSDWGTFDEATLFSDEDVQRDKDVVSYLPDGGRWEQAQTITAPQSAACFFVNKQRLGVMNGEKELIAACEMAISALYQTPEVGEVYDDGHCHYQTQAAVRLREALRRRNESFV